MTISDRIFQGMKDIDMKQTVFSQKTGIAQSTISDWKRKGTSPNADRILVICDVLGISPYELLQDTYHPENKADYRVVTEGTDAFDILVEVEKLDIKKKSRLLGYLEALNQ